MTAYHKIYKIPGKCRIEGCVREAEVKGMCETCYRKYRAEINLLKPKI